MEDQVSDRVTEVAKKIPDFGFKSLVAVTLALLALLLYFGHASYFIGVIIIPVAYKVIKNHVGDRSKMVKTLILAGVVWILCLTIIAPWLDQTCKTHMPMAYYGLQVWKQRVDLDALKSNYSAGVATEVAVARFAKDVDSLGANSINTSLEALRTNIAKNGGIISEADRVWLKMLLGQAKGNTRLVKSIMALDSTLGESTPPATGDSISTPAVPNQPTYQPQQARTVQAQFVSATAPAVQVSESKTIHSGVSSSRAASFFDLFLDSVAVSVDRTIAYVSWTNPRSGDENASIGYTTVLRDDLGNDYSLRSTSGISVGSKVKLGYGERISAVLVFPPLNSGVKFITLDVQDLWRNGPFTLACGV